MKIGLIALSLLLALVHVAFAQNDDPSETFLKAYMTAQQGEKLERDHQFAGALAKFRFAGSLLEELKRAHPTWQPAIVEYRGRKIGESILRVEGKSGTQQDLAAISAPSPADQTQSSPAKPAEPMVEVGSARSKQTTIEAAVARSSPPPITAAGNEAAIKQATTKLQDKIDQLQAELKQSRSKISEVEEEKGVLNDKLRDSDSKLQHAQRDLEQSKTAEKPVRDQLATAQSSLEAIQANGSTDQKAQAALKSEISQLKKTLASAEQGRSSAEKARDAETNKLTEANSRVAQVTKERDEAREQIAGTKQAEQRVQTLVTENTELKDKLAAAEKTVREISADKPKKEQELVEVRKAVETLRGQLAASENQNKDFANTVASLRTQLQEAGGQLEKAKLTGANAEETAKLNHENQLLRNIVVRERQEEARREQTRKLMLTEFSKLRIKSDALNQQIALLAQPVTKLSEEELKLLREPVISISDDSSNTVRASFTYAKPSSNEKPMVEDGGRSGQEPPLPYDFKPNVPTDLVDVAREAKQNFEQGKYHAAERQYQELLTKAPNNLYSLSNLGVVYFRTGKLKAAELTLKKALAIAPGDEFARTTLGIVYYRQSRYDDALNELTKALAINPRSPPAHNYLGITASQKGWQEAAEKELLEAISIKPDYADAHFNLAVIYATASPPSKELAKRHYARATECGAEKDPSLEKLLR